MIIKLKADLDPAARRILDNAANVAQRCATWPSWKRGDTEGASMPAKQKKQQHTVKYVPIGGHSDSFECSCGWKSNGYWDMESAAWGEWLVHAHDVGAYIEPRDKVRQLALVCERDQRRESLRRRRADIDKQLAALEPRSRR